MGAVKGACTLGEGSRHVQTWSSLTSGRTSTPQTAGRTLLRKTPSTSWFCIVCVFSFWLPFVTRLFTIDPTSRQFLLNELTLRVFLRLRVLLVPDPWFITL